MLSWKRHARVILAEDHVSVVLSKGYVAVVDTADYEKVRAYTWSAFETKGLVYAINKFVGLLHRFLLDAKPEDLVDHHDRNGLNNRRSNLRLCASSQNVANSGKHKLCSSKFKGVSWSGRDSKWRAYIKVNYRYKSLGAFDLEEDAARAYNNAAIEHFGQFAAVNALPT